MGFDRFSLGRAVKFTALRFSRTQVRVIFFIFSFERNEWVTAHEEVVSSDHRAELAALIWRVVKRVFADYVCKTYMERSRSALKGEFISRGSVINCRPLAADLTGIINVVRGLGSMKGLKSNLESLRALAEAAGNFVGDEVTPWGHRNLIDFSIKKITVSWTNRLTTYLRGKLQQRKLAAKARAALNRAKWEAGMARAASKERRWLAKYLATQQLRLLEEEARAFAREVKAAKLAAKQARRAARGPSTWVPLSADEREQVRARLGAKCQEARLARSGKAAYVKAARQATSLGSFFFFLRKLNLGPAQLRHIMKKRRGVRYTRHAGESWRQTFVNIFGYGIIYAKDAVCKYVDRSVLLKKKKKISSLLPIKGVESIDFNLEQKYVVSRRKVGRLFVNSDFQVLPRCIEHQGDDDDPLSVDPVAVTSVEQTSNVVNVDQGAVASVASESHVNYPCRMNEGGEAAMIRELCNRYMLLDTGDWKTSSPRDSVLFQYNVPKDIFSKISSSPNVIALKRWEYLSFDLHIRVQVNATRMQAGQIMIGWNYNPDGLKIHNIYELSQAPHVILSSPGSNVAELFIPFKWKYPYWSVGRIASTNHLITVKALVLTALNSPDRVSPSCSYNVQIRLANMKVAGMRVPSQRLFVEHQMFKSVLNVAEGLLRQFGADLNRDNPTEAQQQSAMIPYTSHSWCIGTNQVEVLNQLRLDAIATTPHYEPSDEMRVDFICRHYGYLGSFLWATNYSTGRELNSYNVGPMCLSSCAAVATGDATKQTLNEYMCPPIHVISSMFAYWRGSLEFRFDFVATMFHTGRVVACFVPGPDSLTKMRDCVQSYTQYFDLSNTNSFTFVCPYVCDKTWCETHPPEKVGILQKENSSIGTLKLFVVNPLVAITGVSNQITVNVYLRAGTDFAFAVPCAPCYFPADLGNTYIPSDLTVSILPKYFPCFSGVWRYFGDSRYCICRYSNITDQIAQFGPDLGYNHVYKAQWSMPVYTSPTEQMQCVYFVRARVASDNHFYMAPCRTQTEARNYVTTGSLNWLMPHYVDGAYTWSGNCTFNVVETISNVSNRLEHQGDERLEDHCNVSFGIKNCLTAMHSFNEDFNDLKTLCRRYQLLTDFSAYIEANSPFGATFFRLPIVPYGLVVDYSKLSRGNKIAEFANRVRSGPIGILANGFRFFRGGLRFKILFKEKSNQEVIIGVTHVPDRFDANKMSLVKASSTGDFVTHGYAYICQSAKVNECIEIEVPYYLNADYGILADPSRVIDEDRLQCTLGHLAFCIMSRIPQDIDLGIQIYYAFADDMRFSSFQGFGPVCTQYEIPENKDSITLESTTTVATVGSQPQLSYDSSGSFVLIEHEMWGVPNIKEQISEGVGEALERLEVRLPTIAHDCANEFRFVAGRMTNDIIEKTGEVLNKIKDLFGDIFNSSKASIIAIVSNLVHLLLNPCWKALFVCLTSIICIVFNLSECDAVNRLVNSVMSVLHLIRGSECEEKENSNTNSESIEHQGVEIPVDKIAMISEASATYISMVATIFNLKYGEKKKKYPNFLSLIITSLKEFNFSVSGLSKFLKVNLELLSRVLIYLTNKVCGTELDYIISNYGEDLKNWCRHANMLLNPLNKCRVESEPFLQHSVFVTSAQAQELLLAVSMNDSYSRLSVPIRDIAVNLMKLQERLANDCLAPMCRYEPFVLQINGAPGIGKSVLFQHLGISMLEAIKYRTFSEPMFTRTCGTTYWNGVNTQPIVYYDDFLFACSGELAESQIAEFMQLKSSSVFNPNIAELENKKIRYNPLAVLLASNVAFWRDFTNIRSVSALHRRRDSLWEARIKPDANMKLVKEDFKRTGVRKFDHLLFYKYDNVLDHQSLRSQGISYDEFLDCLKREFISYHTAELGMYRQRLKDLDRLMPPTSDLQYSREAEREILLFLEKVNRKRDDASVEEWRRNVREFSDQSRVSLCGLDPVMQFARKNLGRLNEVEVDHQMDTIDINDQFKMLAEQPSTSRDAYDEEWLNSYLDLENCGNTGHRQEVPDEHRCIHWRDLSARWVFIGKHPDHPEPAYCLLDRRKGYLFIEELCEFGDKCWLKSIYSARWRYKYFYQEYSKRCDAVCKPFMPEWCTEFTDTRDLSQEIDKCKEESKSRLTRLWEGCKSARAVEIIKTTLKWLGLIALGLGSIFGTYNFVRSLSNTTTDLPTSTIDPWHERTTPMSLSSTQDPWHEPEPNYMPSGDNRVLRQKQPRNWQRQAKVRSATLRAKFARPQFDDGDPISTLILLVKRNAFESSIEIDGLEKYRLKGFGICGRIALTTKHFWEVLRKQHEEGVMKNKKVYLVYTTPHGKVKLRFDQLKFSIVDDSSLALVEFPVSINCFRDIRRHIVDTDEIAYCSREGKFIELVGKDYEISNVVYDLVEAIDIGGDKEVSAQHLEMCYSYAVGGKGKCGSVLICVKPVPKIIGIHVAGIPNRNFGYSQAVFREIFDDLSAPELVDPPTAEVQGIRVEPKICIPQGVEYLGTVPSEAVVSMARHSQLIPSIMFDELFIHQTEPAVLTRNDPRVKIDPHIDPMVKAISTHGKISLAFDKKILSKCVSDLTDYLIATTKPQLLCAEELLTDQVIFGGISGGIINKLNLNSSEGYPLCLYRQHNLEERNFFLKDKLEKKLPMTGKNWLFKYEASQNGNILEEIHPELLELMKYNGELRQQNIIPATVFVDTLKDARVTLDKIEKGKTRMFSMSPVEYTWAVKKYFGVFQAAYQESRIFNGTAIGINVQSAEWSLLARTLLNKGNNIVVGDYKAFGDTLERSVMLGAFESIIEWYSEYFNSPKEIKQYRYILIEELFNAVHLATNIVYRMHCGIPSGFALTVEVNDLVNQLYMRYCWCKITNQSLAQYHQHVKTITYGDDLILSVSDDFKDIFHFESIQKCLAEYNIDFQPAAKDGSVYRTLSINDVTFLKSKFVRHPFRSSQFLAELPLSSCLDMINWQYKGNNKIDIVFENTRAALNNLYGHGPEVYSKWRRAFIIWFSKAADRGIISRNDSYVHLKTWEERDVEVFGDNF
uniref:Genome polyprotein n=1 Tax=Lhasa Iflav tick virus 1 TaxID=2972187 RepID=A0A9E7V1U8_9VIRU|nr:MAG: polyprotein [Lhasa Iflav tick virus 1]